MKTLICIPTYNERSNLEQLVPIILKIVPNAHILVIDDGSPDGTGRLADKFSQNDERVKVLHRKEKLGLATAYVQGFKFGLHCNYDSLMSMDADFSHDPKFLTDFLKFSTTHDLVIGSRYIDEGGTKNWGLLRKIISRFGGMYARIMLDCPIFDLTGGYNLYSSKLLREINLDDIKSQGYSFQIELKYRCFRKGAKIMEIPIIFEDRRVGQSKMSAQIFLEAILRVPLFRFQIKK